MTSGIARLITVIAFMQSIGALAQMRSALVAPDKIPIDSGVTIVQAISGDAKQGDYESTLTVSPTARTGVRITSRAFVKDDLGIRRWLLINRQVRAEDLLAARLQILGFDTADPDVIAGATAIGPSVAVMKEVARDGRADHVIRNYASRRDNKGTLQRVSTVPFPVVVNGARVTVPAVVVRGSLGIPGSMRPWELQVLDHPVHPVTLKVSYGPENAPAAVAPEWSRQVVRIDFSYPGAASGAAASVAEQLTDDCRARVPGIYFEFDSDVLNPASEPALKAVADLLRKHPDWNVEIEGHTDNVGGAKYNVDLSERRAASVKRALVSDYAIAAAHLTSRGFGLTRPVESNETVEGRAMNRRVELVRQCK